VATIQDELTLDPAAGVLTTAAARPLETGWLPDTPVEDTLLRRFVHNQAAHNATMATAHGGRVERTDDVFLADCAGPVAFLPLTRFTLWAR